MQPVLEGPYKEAQVAPPGPSEFRSREQTVADKLNGFIIDFIISGLCQLSQHVNDKKFNFVRVQEAEQDWTDKGDHDYSASSGQGVRCAAGLSTTSPASLVILSGAFIKASSSSVVVTAAISVSRVPQTVRTEAR